MKHGKISHNGINYEFEYEVRRKYTGKDEIVEHTAIYRGKKLSANSEKGIVELLKRTINEA